MRGFLNGMNHPDINPESTARTCPPHRCMPEFKPLTPQEVLGKPHPTSPAHWCGTARQCFPAASLCPAGAAAAPCPQPTLPQRVHLVS